METFFEYLPYFLAAIFALAGFGKGIGLAFFKREFKHWNLPNEVCIATGLVEIMTAVLLVWPSTLLYGLWLTTILMTGAVTLLIIASAYKRIIVPLTIYALATASLFHLGMPSFSALLLGLESLFLLLVVVCFAYAPTPHNQDGEVEILSSGTAVTHRFKASLKDVKYHFVETGDSKNETVVIIPGAPESWFAFHHVIGALASQYHVIALDLKPYGQTDKDLDGDHRFEHIAKEIATLIDGLGIKKFHLIGHDRGAVAADQLVAVPQMNTRIIKYIRMQQSFNEPHGEPVPPHHLMQRFWANIAYKFRWGMWFVYAKSYYVYQPLPQDIIARLDKEFKFKGLNLAMPLSFKTTSFDKEKQDRFDYIFEKMNMPTLILQGKYDPGQHPEEYENSPKFIKNGRVVFIEAGHFFHLENPTDTNRVILDFLKPNSISNH